MRNGNKIVKSVSLNRTNEDDMLILEHVGERNFSGYVKDLVMRDIRMSRVKTNGGGGRVKVVVV